MIYSYSFISLFLTRCFGIVHRMQDSPGYTCSLFAELDAHQPVSNIVAYMKRLLQSTKRI